MRSAKNIIHHELIGSTIEIVDSKNPDNVGIKGKVLDETKNTIQISALKGTKKVLKKDVVFVIKINDQKVLVKGEALVKNPKDRIKKL